MWVGGGGCRMREKEGASNIGGEVCITQKRESARLDGCVT